MPLSETVSPMNVPEYVVRVDPIHGWPVCYASRRALRPFDFHQHKPLACPENDPFAEGHEDITTPETLAIRPPGSPSNGPGWQVRVIPNKYPALQALAGVGADSASPCQGIHEVIVECPQRETHFTRLEEQQRICVLQAMRQRLEQLSIEPALRHATIFKNHGQAAGASLAHSHSQLIATTFVPPYIRREIDFRRAYRQRTGLDHAQEQLERELRDQTRLVEVSPSLVVYCPEVSRFGLEMRILPRSPELHFHRSSPALITELNGLLTRALRRLERIAGDTGYNLVLHTAPFQEDDLEGFRWHWEIYPRIAGIAGWELGAGGYVNAILPETAAKLLRDVSFG